MAQIDFRKKINWHRRYRSPQGVKTEHEILRIFESDRGRIINSPAILRLYKSLVIVLRPSDVGIHPTHRGRSYR